MDGPVNNGRKKKGIPKKLIAILAAALIIIGGSVAAYAMLTGSAKAQYFLAEKNTIEFIGDKFEERFQPEFDWAEQASKNATETSYELSAAYNGPVAAGIGVPPQLINNSTIELTTQMNQKKAQMMTDVNVNFGGVEINDIHVFLNENDLLLKLPFLQETLKITDKDLSKLLKESNPAITGELDFNTVFKSLDGSLSEEDHAYIYAEYLTFIYEQLPKDAFKTKDETVKVQDKSVDAKKITMKLSEKQVKNILRSVLEKMKKDDRLKALVRKQLEIQQLGTLSATSGSGQMQNNIQTALENYDKALDKIMNGLKNFQIPDGLTSEIWVHDDLIVKRNMKISIAPKGEKPSTLTVNGTQLLSDTSQKVKYKLAVDQQSFTVTANLSNQDNKLKDSISFSDGKTDITYNGSSSLKDGTREFERSFSVEGAGTFIWTGEADYNNDRMSSENNITMETPDLQQDMIDLQIDKEAKTIKKVDQPGNSNLKNIGDMSPIEMQQYMEQEIRPQFQQWFMSIMGFPGGMNGF
ncbi:DUF6583 family protein [Virgibacillus siamensis]|uniref:DUF6583 family protein n=1 Tax=Virgibacillus siamensis TaxID=480071 RepID=UPI0009854796|nr:DUF6583 family protein [Virgibacillus siamensis]